VHTGEELNAERIFQCTNARADGRLAHAQGRRRAVETAAGSLRDLRVAEVTKMDMRVENGKVLAFRTRVALSFKYEA